MSVVKAIPSVGPAVRELIEALKQGDLKMAKRDELARCFELLAHQMSGSQRLVIAID